MTSGNLINFLLLVRATDLAWGDRGSASNPIIAFVVLGVIAAVVIVVIIYGRKSAGVSGGASSGILSGLSMNRLAKTIGLNHEQKKMLAFVFKTDSVTDPEKSISNPALLDRHFRRAYRVIEQSSRNESEAQQKLSVLFSTRNLLENSSIGGFTNTRQIKDDTVLLVTSQKEKMQLHVITTKSDFIAVEIPTNALGSQIKIPKGTVLSIMFFTKNNKAFSFETRVVGFSNTHGHPSMHLAHSNHLKFLSQRRFRRRQAVIACSMYLVYVEGSGKKQRLIVDKRLLTGNIADVSVGGCSIKTAVPVQVGARFKIEFSQGDGNVAALGQVLRTNRTGATTIIHIKFLRVSQRSMNIINAFVYEYAHE